MAPELFNGHPPSETADLYAAGMIAYEVLIGHYPFDMTNLDELIRNITLTIPDLSNSGLSSDLNRVIERLIAKDPELRYHSASEVLTALSEATNQSLTLETATIRESFLQAARLAGRDAEMAQLSDLLSESISGHDSAWLIGGESGAGKSRLADELRSLAQVRGALVVRGVAVNAGGSLYELWREPLRRFVLQCDPDDTSASVLKTLVPDIGPCWGAIFPMRRNCRRSLRRNACST